MKNQFFCWLFAGMTVFLLVGTVVQLQAQRTPSAGAVTSHYVPDLTVDNIFRAAVSNRKPPRILDTLSTTLEDGDIVVTRIRFESVIDSARTNRIFAYLIYPKNKHRVPALLMLHGGTQTADDYYQLGLRFARRGYATLIPDLPGITSPEWASRKGNGSSGKWAEHPYGQDHFLVLPTVRASNIYEGIITAVQSFYLLKSQSFVDPNAVGIRGLSWGGYATVMTTALLGRQVKAGFAVYGSGFYDLSSYFKTIVDKLAEPARRAWLSSLDAGRYASQIKSPFYFMAAANDTYFHPPAVAATFAQLKRLKYILFSPNNDHSLSNTPDPEATELAFFDYYLRQKGEALPRISLKKIAPNAQSSAPVIAFEVIGRLPLREANVWYTTSGGAWPTHVWQPVVPTATGLNQYRATLPNPAAGTTLHWYVTVTDDRQVSTGTDIHCVNAFRNGSL
ncbi:alpha/beta hydrolase family protein [uncultured Fibrella sp.]|uniref:alpha/beta hydrolase family protein n=1 Tax=uncultured Fibrella sp. TaxID=1284596 RepID=UPI0035CA93D8